MQGIRNEYGDVIKLDNKNVKPSKWMSEYKESGRLAMMPVADMFELTFSEFKTLILLNFEYWHNYMSLQFEDCKHLYREYIQFTNQMLSEELGLSIGTVSKAVNSLQNKGLIHIKRKKTYFDGKFVTFRGIKVIDTWQS